MDGLWRTSHQHWLEQIGVMQLASELSSRIKANRMILCKRYFILYINLLWDNIEYYNQHVAMHSIHAKTAHICKSVVHMHGQNILTRYINNASKMINKHSYRYCVCRRVYNQRSYTSGCLGLHSHV